MAPNPRIGLSPEMPARNAHLPCPDVTGQSAPAHAIDTTGFPAGVAAGLSATGFLCDGEGVEAQIPVGATVYFTASNVSRPAATGTYEVIRQLPSEGDDCQYRIKSSTEAFERVAKESQLAVS